MIQRKVIPLIEDELKNFKKNIVITGMRRVGKTTIIKYLYKNLKDCRKIYLDLENPLTQSIFEEIDYDKILSNLILKAEGIGKKIYIFLDEIQNVKSIPSIVKYISDHNKVKFIMTGSASFYLKNLFTESLSGRKRIFEVFPLSFREYLDYKEVSNKHLYFDKKISLFDYNSRQKYWEEYQKYGGFPSVVLHNSDRDKMAELNDIYSSYYQNEILKLSDFKKIDSLKNIMRLLISRTGSKLDITKISRELGVTRITVSEYLEFLEGTYFISKIKPFSNSYDVSLRGREKLYICDTGILTLLGGVSNGSIFENAIFNILKTNNNIYYFESKNSQEIDFIIKGKDKKLKAIEIKSFATNKDITRLAKLSKGLNISEYFVVSQKYVDLDGVVYPFQLD